MGCPSVSGYLTHSGTSLGGSAVPRGTASRWSGMQVLLATGSPLSGRSIAAAGSNSPAAPHTEKDMPDMPNLDAGPNQPVLVCREWGRKRSPIRDPGPVGAAPDHLRLLQGRRHRGHCPAPPPLVPCRRHSRLQHSSATVARKLEGPRGSQLATRADSGLCCKARPNPLVPAALAGAIPETGQGMRPKSAAGLMPTAMWTAGRSSTPPKDRNARPDCQASAKTSQSLPLADQDRAAPAAAGWRSGPDAVAATSGSSRSGGRGRGSSSSVRTVPTRSALRGISSRLTLRFISQAEPAFSAPRPTA